MRRAGLITLTAMLAVAMWASLTSLRAQEEQVRAAGQASQPTMLLVDQAREAVVRARDALVAEDVYHCCITPVCSFCELITGNCDCAENLQEGRGGVCPECYGGWYAGQGALTGELTKTSEGYLRYEGTVIKVMPISVLRSMYLMRLQHLSSPSQPGQAGQPR